MDMSNKIRLGNVKPININVENRGVLTRDEVADLLQEADIFVDFSTYQAFGRTGLEAMACGCAVILPAIGGVYEYAIHNDNALIVDTSNEGEMLNNLLCLIEDDILRERFQRRGMETAETFSIGSAALSELSLFRMALAEKAMGVNSNIIDNLKEKNLENNKRENIRISVWPCVLGDGIQPAGSAYIRLLQTLRHTSLENKLEVKIVNSLEDVKSFEVDILVVQRNAIKNVLLSNAVVNFCRDHNIKLVHEIDDDLFRMHESGHKALPENELQALNTIIQAADRVVTSSPVLQDELKHRNTRIICVPNAHDENLWLDRKDGRYIQPKSPKRDHPLRILYMGTRTHAKDLSVLTEAWKRIEAGKGIRMDFDKFLEEMKKW